MSDLNELYFPKGIKQKIYKFITKHPDFIFYKAVKMNTKYRYAKDNNKIFMKFIYSFVTNRIASKYNIELYGKYGDNLRIWHGNIVINGNAKMGNNVQLHGNNCVGNTSKGVPIVGNNVDIGFGATIIGKVKIEDNVIIGANSLINKDCKKNGIYVGNPARVVKYHEESQKCNNNK